MWFGCSEFSEIYMSHLCSVGSVGVNGESGSWPNVPEIMNEWGYIILQEQTTAIGKYGEHKWLQIVHNQICVYHTCQNKCQFYNGPWELDMFSFTHEFDCLMEWAGNVYPDDMEIVFHRWDTVTDVVVSITVVLFTIGYKTPWSSVYAV